MPNEAPPQAIEPVAGSNISAQLVQGPWYKNPLVYFAGASAIAAAFSAYAGMTNAGIAQGQAAITRMQYTPQLSFDIDPVRVFQHPQMGPLVGTTIHVKNVGNITVYNATVSASMMYFPTNQIGQIWSQQNLAQEGITLAPTEDEKLDISFFAPTDQQMAEMRSGKLRLVAVGRIHFTDELGRNHNRYACAQIRAVENMLVGEFCPTPKQG